MSAAAGAARVWTHKLIVMSDLHLTGDGTRIIGLDPQERSRAVLQHALARHADADALILLGDLAHHGEPVAYAMLDTLLADVPCPVLPMLGNHDRREAFRRIFPQAPRTAEGFVQAVLDLPGWRVLTLDTLDGPPYPEGHHSGRLCEERLAWLDAAIGTAQDRNLLVCAHHPPFAVGFPGMDAIALADGSALIDRLAAHGRAHLLCGHVHRTISGSTRGVPWTIFKSPCHQAPLDLFDPDSSLSIDEVGAYGVVLLAPVGAIVHTEDVGRTDPTVIGDPGSRTMQRE